MRTALNINHVHSGSLNIGYDIQTSDIPLMKLKLEKKHKRYFMAYDFINFFIFHFLAEKYMYPVS